MFASELAEAELALARRVRRRRGLVGYLVLSRYVDAWHVMNVAVAPSTAAAASPRALLERLFEETSGDPRRGYTLEVRVSNTAAIALYESFGFVARGTSAAATTPTTVRTR